MLFFGLSTWALALLLLVVVVGATVAGHLLGRSKREKSDDLREPFAVIQAALIGFMGLVLAFGISLAVGRYEARRAAVVDEGNAVGTAYLRAQTLAEPVRSQSLGLLQQYTDVSIRLTSTVPDSPAEADVVAASGALQRRLWALVGPLLDAAPVATAPRLYVESLNEMFDAQSTRVFGLRNRVPTAVLLLEVLGAAVALGALALHLATIGRGPVTVLMAALLVVAALQITFDLDRPTRGLIVISDQPLTQLRASMVPVTGPGG